MTPFQTKFFIGLHPAFEWKSDVDIKRNCIDINVTLKFRVTCIGNPIKDLV